jgi:hypothetical protein
VIVPHRHLLLHARGGGEDAVHAARGERERPLAENMEFRRECTENVRFVQMVRGHDDDRVELRAVDQVLDIREHVGDAEALRDLARLHAVGIAERHELRALELGERGQVRDLGDRARSDEADADGRIHRSVRGRRKGK